MGELLGYDPSYVSLLERCQRTINDRQGLVSPTPAETGLGPPWT